jgi:integrase
MPKMTFTQLAVERLKPPAAGRITYWDRNLPGFGLRVAAPRPGAREGRKTWIAWQRVDGRGTLVTLGTLAQIPRVDQARALARGAILTMKAGAKPLDERRAEKDRRAAEAAEAAAAAIEAVEGRFQAVAERFLAEYGAAKGWAPKYAAEFRRIIAHDVLPSWRDRPIRGIGKHDVNELLDAKASRRERARKGTAGGAAVQANRVLTRLKTLFGWAAANDLIDAAPSVGVLRRGKERSRDRVLSDDEVVWFWRASERAGWPWSAIQKLLLLTAQRESEVSGMYWSEVEKRIWTIPRERTKSDRAHVVHLSELAAEIIGALPRLGTLVFPTRTGSAISSFSRAKDRLDSLMTAQKREATGDPEAEIAGWVLHDLRRTATTVMAEQLKVAPHVADKILNHDSGSIRGVAAIYNRSAYIDERRAALESLGRWIEARVRPGGAGNVVALRG